LSLCSSLEKIKKKAIAIIVFTSKLKGCSSLRL
jgi:hypothetical protein